MSLDTEKLKKLREITGAGMMECKRALEQAAGDLGKAQETLRKAGYDKAGRYSDREAAKGRIEAYVHSTDSQKGKCGVLLELACQTDFVARNEEFAELAHDLCLQICALKPQYISKEDVPPERVELERKKYADEVKGKPPEIAAKILEGKLNKNFFADRCLMQMPFFNEAKFKGTVEELIRSKIAKFGENIYVRRFLRFALGEETIVCERARQ